jgi:hypothetical protein
MLISAFAITACNKNDGDSGTKPKLAGGQVKKIMNSLSSLGQMTNSKRENQKNNVLSLSRSESESNLLLTKMLVAMAAPPSPEETSTEAPEESVKERAQKLERMVNETNCTFHYPHHESKLEIIGQKHQLSSQTASNQFSIPTFKVEISGPKCPVAITMELQGSADEKAVNAQFSWQFKAISEEFIRETEITELNLLGNLSMSATSQNPDTMAMIMNMSFTGNGLSKTQGAFTLDSRANLNMEMQMANGKEPLPGSPGDSGSPGLPGTPGENPDAPGMNPGMQGFRLTFSDTTTLSADGKSLSFGRTFKQDGMTTAPTEEYFIDGAKVSQQEYIKTIGEMKIPGLEGIGGDTGENGNEEPPRIEPNPSPRPPDRPINPGPHSDIECKSTFYETYEYSIEELRRYAELGLGFEPPTNLTTTGSAISTQKQTELFGIAKAHIRYDFSGGNARVSILVRENTGKLSTSPVFHYNPIDDGRSKADAYEVGNFLVYVNCLTL